MNSWIALLGATLIVPSYLPGQVSGSSLVLHPKQAARLKPDSVTLLPSENPIFKLVSLRECRDFNFANSVLFATCASERAFVDLNRCVGNEDGFLTFKTK
jgi:hypothetical protein